MEEGEDVIMVEDGGGAVAAAAVTNVAGASCSEPTRWEQFVQKRKSSSSSGSKRNRPRKGGHGGQRKGAGRPRSAPRTPPSYIGPLTYEQMIVYQAEFKKYQMSEIARRQLERDRSNPPPKLNEPQLKRVNPKLLRKEPLAEMLVPWGMETWGCSSREEAYSRLVSWGKPKIVALIREMEDKKQKHINDRLKNQKYNPSPVTAAIAASAGAGANTETPTAAAATAAGTTQTDAQNIFENLNPEEKQAWEDEVERETAAALLLAASGGGGGGKGQQQDTTTTTTDSSNMPPLKTPATVTKTEANSNKEAPLAGGDPIHNLLTDPILIKYNFRRWEKDQLIQMLAPWAMETFSETHDDAIKRLSKFQDWKTPELIEQLVKVELLKHQQAYAALRELGTMATPGIIKTANAAGGGTTGEDGDCDPLIPSTTGVGIAAPNTTGDTAYDNRYVPPSDQGQYSIQTHGGVLECSWQFVPEYVGKVPKLGYEEAEIYDIEETLRKNVISVVIEKHNRFDQDGGDGDYTNWPASSRPYTYQRTYNRSLESVGGKLTMAYRFTSRATLPPKPITTAIPISGTLRPIVDPDEPDENAKKFLTSHHINVANVFEDDEYIWKRTTKDRAYWTSTTIVCGAAPFGCPNLAKDCCRRQSLNVRGPRSWEHCKLVMEKSPLIRVPETEEDRKIVRNAYMKERNRLKTTNKRTDRKRRSDEAKKISQRQLPTQRDQQREEQDDDEEEGGGNNDADDTQQTDGDDNMVLDYGFEEHNRKKSEAAARRFARKVILELAQKRAANGREIVTVKLEKQPGIKLGLIVARKEGGKKIVINAIKEGGLVAGTTNLKVGMEIYSINGIEVSGKSSTEAAKMFRDASGTFTVIAFGQQKVDDDKAKEGEGKESAAEQEKSKEVEEDEKTSSKGSSSPAKKKKKKDEDSTESEEEETSKPPAKKKQRTTNDDDKDGGGDATTKPKQQRQSTTYKVPFPPPVPPPVPAAAMAFAAGMPNMAGRVGAGGFANPFGVGGPTMTNAMMMPNPMAVGGVGLPPQQAAIAAVAFEQGAHAQRVAAAAAAAAVAKQTANAQHIAFAAAAAANVAKGATNRTSGTIEEKKKKSSPSTPPRERKPRKCKQQRAKEAAKAKEDAKLVVDVDEVVEGKKQTNNKKTPVDSNKKEDGRGAGRRCSGAPFGCPNLSNDCSGRNANFKKCKLVMAKSPLVNVPEGEAEQKRVIEKFYREDGRIRTAQSRKRKQLAKQAAAEAANAKNRGEVQESPEPEDTSADLEPEVPSNLVPEATAVAKRIAKEAAAKATNAKKTGEEENPETETTLEEDSPGEKRRRTRSGGP